VTSLEPRLTSLDERVLEQLPASPPGVRASAIARTLGPKRAWSGVPIVDTGQVRLILRGFEHLGRARQRNGWWTRSGVEAVSEPELALRRLDARAG
jgi:hypothetical protein